MITGELSLDLTEEEEAWWSLNESSANEEDLLNPPVTSQSSIALQITQNPKIASQVQRQSPTQSGDPIFAQGPITQNIIDDEVSQVISLINDKLLPIIATGTKRKILNPKKLRRPASSESENDETKEKKRQAYRKEVEERRVRAVFPPEQNAQPMRPETPVKGTKGPLNVIRRPPRTPKLPNDENNNPQKKGIPALMSLVLPVPEKFRKQLVESKQDQEKVCRDRDQEKDNDDSKDEGVFIRNQPEKGLNSFPFIRLPNSYMSTRILFSGLDPEPYDKLADAPHYSCFNYREEGHSRKNCLQEEEKIVCHNCERWGFTIKTYPRFKIPGARSRYRQYCKQMGENAKPIWIMYPHLFAAPPYRDSWQDDPHEKITPPKETHDDDEEDIETALNNSPKDPTDIKYLQRRSLLLQLFGLDLENVPLRLRVYAIYLPLPEAIKIARKYKK